MKLSPSWESTSRLATKEFPNILRNPKVSYCVPIRSQTNLVHTTQSYYFKISFNIIFLPNPIGTRGSVVGWGTMLQARRSRVRVLMS
jgi:hypothetical protein